MNANSVPEDFTDGFDEENSFDEDADFDEGDGFLFECPFCGSEEDSCPHFLGSRDLNFCRDFTLDGFGKLSELSELFRVLGEEVTAFLEDGEEKVRTDILKPKRLRDLLQAVEAGAKNKAFNEYIKRLGKDTGVPVAAHEYEEDGGPGFCSVVLMFWAERPSEAIAGMRSRLDRDIKRLKEQIA